MPITSANQPTGAPGRPCVEAGYGWEHRARVIRPEWLAERELVLAMDAGHQRQLQALAARAGLPADGVRMLREFDPDGAGDVPGPLLRHDRRVPRRPRHA